MFRTELWIAHITNGVPWAGGKIPREILDIVDTSRDHQNNSDHGIPPAQGGGNPNVSREGTFGKAGAPLAPKCCRQESLTHSSYFCREEGPNVLRAAPKMGHSASTRLMQMQELLPTQAAVSQPSSQRSDWFQLTELLPAHFRDHLENRCWEVLMDEQSTNASSGHSEQLLWTKSQPQHLKLCHLTLSSVLIAQNFPEGQQSCSAPSSLTPSQAGQCGSFLLPPRAQRLLVARINTWWNRESFPEAGKAAGKHSSTRRHQPGTKSSGWAQNPQLNLASVENPKKILGKH